MLTYSPADIERLFRMARSNVETAKERTLRLPQSFNVLRAGAKLHAALGLLEDAEAEFRSCSRSGRHSEWEPKVS